MPRHPTRAAFMTAYREELARAGFSPSHVATHMHHVANLLFDRPGVKADLAHGRLALKAWRAIGGKGRLCHGTLRMLPNGCSISRDVQRTEARLNGWPWPPRDDGPAVPLLPGFD